MLAFVADAIGSGKRGAFAIHCYLNGKDAKNELRGLRIGGKRAFAMTGAEPVAIDLKSVVTSDKINTLCFPYGERNDNPDVLAPEERVTTFHEITGGLDPTRMAEEASRCFKCGTCTECDLCFLLCPDISITKAKTGGYGVRTDYCKGCGICATTCPRHVIEISEANPENAIREAKGIEKAGPAPRDAARTASESGEALPATPVEPEVGALAGATQAPIIEMSEGATQAPIDAAAGGAK